MATLNDAIAHSLTIAQALVKRYTDDLKPQEYLHRPAEKANCTAWLLGHLALSDRRTLEAMGAQVPALPEGFAERFSQKEGCPQAIEFGDVSQAVSAFHEHRSRLIEAVRQAAPEQLDKPLARAIPNLAQTVGELANFMAVHSAMHAGQITIIRRSLGKPPVV
jgi:uncharacterized damage-inducible protein DinB